ncbi:MAG: hypothetical protein AABX54_03940 [Nanoarchaeota archaeon]
MPRLKGSKDLKKRKERKDKDKKRKRVNLIRFPKKTGHKEIIKLYVWKKDYMTLEGFHRWSKKIRPKIKRIVYKPVLRIDVNVEDISNEEKLKQFMVDNFWDGYFIIRGVSGSVASTYRRKWVRMAEVKIIDTSEGLRAFIKNKSRMSKYWFWRGG